MVYSRLERVVLPTKGLFWLGCFTDACDAGKMADDKRMVNPMFGSGDEENGGSQMEYISTSKDRAQQEPELKAELQIDELSDLRATFEACDTDKSGGMDMQEFTVVLRLWGVEEDPAQLAAELIAEAKKIHANQSAQAKASFKQLLRKIGLPWGMKETPSVGDKELSFAEFVLLVEEGSVVDKVEDWLEGAFHMRLFKSGYDTADTDGNGELTHAELYLAIGSLQAGKLSDAEFDQIWAALNPAQKPFLTFPEFMDGMVEIKCNQKLGLADKFNLTKPNQLMALLMDTPVAAWEHKEILSSFVLMEKMGIKVLEKHNEEMLPEVKVTLMQRSAEGSIHTLHDGQREKLKTLHRHNVKIAFLCGFISCFCSSIVENILTWQLNTDGTADLNTWNDTTQSYSLLDHNDQPSQTRFLMFWVINGGALGICTAIEIAGLYYFGIKNAMRVANKLDMRLLPLNRVRATVAQSLIRAALELGQANEVMFGVDPLRDMSTKSSIINALIAVIYLAKIALTGFVMKVVLKRFMARGGAKYALPWMSVPACAAWNALVGNAIMREAKLRGLGVAAGVELFNAMSLANENISRDGMQGQSKILKLQLVRAIACNVVKCKNFYPTKEVLLRHALAYTGQMEDFKGVLGGEAGTIDVVEDFIMDMSQLTPEEQKLVVQVLALCSILDGRLKKKERALYEAAAEACNLPNNQQRLKVVASKFRNMEPIDITDLQGVCEDEPLEPTFRYYVNEVCGRCALCLAC